MNVQKLPSGSYRVRQMVDGKTYSFTLDHKPTNSEIARLMADKISEKRVTGKSTVEKACNYYIESKSNILSPATIRGYDSLMRQMSPAFASRNVSSVTVSVLQAEVNRYTGSHSAKSTRNFAGFIQSVLIFYGADPLNVTVPPKEKHNDYIPSKEDMKAIFDEMKGTRYEAAIYLASLGLRRSEICALELSDLDGCTLTINKALVQDKNKHWIVKRTKTTDSTRTIMIPQELADLIQEQGFVYEGDPEMIYCALTKAQKKLGLPHFSLHKLRHFFASYMHNLGYSDKQIQEFGGWKTDAVMKTVYQHALDMDETKKKMAENIRSLFS